MFGFQPLICFGCTFRMHGSNPPTCVNLCLGSTLLLSSDLHDARDHLAVDLDVGTRPLRNETKIMFVCATPWKINMLNPKMEVWKMLFPFNRVIFSVLCYFSQSVEDATTMCYPVICRFYVAIQFYFKILPLNQTVFQVDGYGST